MIAEVAFMGGSANGKHLTVETDSHGVPPAELMVMNPFDIIDLINQGQGPRDPRVIVYKLEVSMLHGTPLWVYVAPVEQS